MATRELSPTDIDRACGLLARIYAPANVVYGKGVHVPAKFPRDDLDWLAAHGLAPNQRRTETHDALVTRVVSAKRRWSIADGARAFTASLDAGTPPHPVLLEAVLLAHRMPRHDFTVRGKGTVCNVCGLEKDVTRDRAEEFLDWHRQGSGIPGALTWAALALEHLGAWAKRVPTAAARSRLFSILKALDELPATARAGKAIEAVHELGYFVEGKRHPWSSSIVEMLAFAGVLEAPPHIGLATGFVSYAERDARPTARTEVDAPLGFWTGKHGVNWKNAKALFGLDKKSIVPKATSAVVKVSAPKRNPAPAPSPGKTLKRRPAAAGDVWSVRVREDAYVLAYVWSVASDGTRDRALVEYLDWFGSELPGAEVVKKLATRPRYDGRWQMKAHGLEKTTGLALIAEKIGPPKAARPSPDRLPIGSGKELIYLASNCFPELES